MSFLKKIQLLISCAIFLICCKQGPGSNTDSTNDLVSYKEVPPGYISDADFSRYYNGVNGFYDSVLLSRGFNGAILVAKNGKIIFEKYKGYANLETKDTLTEHSSFHLASVSKTFTAMAILKLAEQGKLKLDDDVIWFFPTFPYNGITVRMLLNHRSSLPNYLYFMEKSGWDKSQYCDNTDVLNYMINFKPPLSRAPDTHFSYCNTNYILLALIIEKASDKSYAEYLKHEFFTPLKMKDTYVFTLLDTSRAMPSYNWKGQLEPYTFLDKCYGDKNIYSTPKDLLKWDQALYNNQLFKPETIESAFKPYSNEKPGIKNYGYGWRMNIYPNGKKIIFHGGWWHGNNTMFIRLPQDSATIIVLGNRYNRNVYQANKIANIFSNYFLIDEEDKSDIVKETEPNINNDTLLTNNKKAVTR